MNLLVKENLEIIKNLETSLSVKISSPKIKDNVFNFFNNVKKVLAQINRAAGDGRTPVKKQVVTGNLADEFRENIRLLLVRIPEEQLTPMMNKLGDGFADSMNKLVSHLDDDNWLQKPGTVVGAEEDVQGSPAGLSLALEKDGDESEDGKFSAVLSSKPPLKPEPPSPSPPSTLSPSPKSADKRGLGYPMGYHALSDGTTLGQILEPLFNLVFISTVTSARHCKKHAGVSLNQVLSARLGPKTEGNTLLYKILTNKILDKIFHDDRIIAILSQSINIALLKVVIATALYRLGKKPILFKTLGGVAYFMDIEEDMLGSALINDFLCRFVGTASGARGMFRSGSQEWYGLLERIERDPQTAERIISGLPEKPTLATKYWPIKFSAVVVSGNQMAMDGVKELFIGKHVDKIKQVNQHLQY